MVKVKLFFIVLIIIVLSGCANPIYFKKTTQTDSAINSRSKSNYVQNRRSNNSNSSTKRGVTDRQNYGSERTRAVKPYTLLPQPLHHADELIHSTNLYDLYTRSPISTNDKWCSIGGYAELSLVLKVDKNYVIGDENYKQLVIDELLPIIKKECNPLKRALIYNYVKGTRLIRYNSGLYFKFSENDSSFPHQKSESEINSAIVELNARNITDYRLVGDPQNLAGLPLSTMDIAEVDRTNKLRREQEEKERAERNAKYAESVQQAKDRLAATTTSSDGKLIVGTISLDNRELFLHMYHKEFEKASKVSSWDYKPYLMYGALIQIYSDLCKSSLSKDKVSVDFERNRHLFTAYYGWSKTHYIRKEYVGSVWMEPRFEKNYLNSQNLFQQKYSEHHSQFGEGWNPMSYAKHMTDLAKPLFIDTRELVASNKCGGQSLIRFMDNLTEYVNR